MPKRSERGSAVAVLMIATALLAVCCQMVIWVGGAAIQRSQAQAAADAGALAGAVGGADAARRAVQANGGLVVTSSGSVGDFDVTVLVGESKSRARAHAR